MQGCRAGQVLPYHSSKHYLFLIAVKGLASPVEGLFLTVLESRQHVQKPLLGPSASFPEEISGVGFSVLSTLMLKSSLGKEEQINP